MQNLTALRFALCGLILILALGSFQVVRHLDMDANVSTLLVDSDAVSAIDE